MVGASAANVFQAREEVRRFPLFSMIAWSMAAGALMNTTLALAMAGPPVFDSRPSYWFGPRVRIHGGSTRILDSK